VAVVDKQRIPLTMLQMFSPTLAIKSTATKVIAIAGATLLLSAPAVAGAHEGQKNPEVRYRHAVMEAMSNNFAAMAAIFKNDVNRPDELVVHARAMAESASLVGGLFPVGSEGAAALPLIWEEPEKVAAASDEAAAAAAALVEAAASGDRATITKAFVAAGAGCKGCHERYKAEDD